LFLKTSYEKAARIFLFAAGRLFPDIAILIRRKVGGAFFRCIIAEKRYDGNGSVFSAYFTHIKSAFIYI
jgi:hypothetical protein